jgi:hypothetical protein
MKGGATSTKSFRTLLYSTDVGSAIEAVVNKAKADF